MGGDLTTQEGSGVLSFVMYASKGPKCGNLDRIQVVKDGVDAAGTVHDKIFDVAWSGDREIRHAGKLPPVGNTVDISTATYTNSIGAPQLAATWTDPEFDAVLPVLYYLRILEVPTPRWSTCDAVNLGIDPPESFPATIQKRAWSSLIWYNPIE